MNIDIKKDPEKGPFCIDFNNLGYIEAKKTEVAHYLCKVLKCYQEVILYEKQ